MQTSWNMPILGQPTYFPLIAKHILWFIVISYLKIRFQSGEQYGHTKGEDFQLLSHL